MRRARTAGAVLAAGRAEGLSTVAGAVNGDIVSSPTPSFSLRVDPFKKETNN